MRYQLTRMVQPGAVTAFRLVDRSAAADDVVGNCSLITKTEGRDA
jgi:hypothetical protein